MTFPAPLRGVSVVAGSLCVVAVLATLCGACAHKGAGQPRDLREVLLAYDDNRPSAALTFPTMTYEALVRFEPTGKQRPWRLWMLAQAPGKVTVTLYRDTVFTAPGEPLDTFTREIGADDVSSGRDGRWMVEDLQNLAPLDAPIWVGVRKTAGAPALWTSAVSSGQSFLRDRDPSRGVSILPVKRTPMLRLELTPAK